MKNQKMKLKYQKLKELLFRWVVILEPGVI